MNIQFGYNNRNGAPRAPQHVSSMTMGSASKVQYPIPMPMQMGPPKSQDWEMQLTQKLRSQLHGNQRVTSPAAKSITKSHWDRCWSSVELADRLFKGEYGPTLFRDAHRCTLTQQTNNVIKPLSVLVNADGKPFEFETATDQGMLKCAHKSVVGKWEFYGIGHDTFEEFLEKIQHARWVVLRVTKILRAVLKRDQVAPAIVLRAIDKLSPDLATHPMTNFRKKRALDYWISIEFVVKALWPEKSFNYYEISKRLDANELARLNAEEIEDKGQPEVQQQQQQQQRAIPASPCPPVFRRVSTESGNNGQQQMQYGPTHLYSPVSIPKAQNVNMSKQQPMPFVQGPVPVRASAILNSINQRKRELERSIAWFKQAHPLSREQQERTAKRQRIMNEIKSLESSLATQEQMSEHNMNEIKSLESSPFEQQDILQHKLSRQNSDFYQNNKLNHTSYKMPLPSAGSPAIVDCTSSTDDESSNGSDPAGARNSANNRVKVEKSVIEINDDDNVDDDQDGVDGDIKGEDSGDRDGDDQDGSDGNVEGEDNGDGEDDIESSEDNYWEDGDIVF